MRRVLRGVARDITHELANGVGAGNANGVGAGKLSPSEELDTLVGRLAGEVMRLIDEEGAYAPKQNALQRRLSALEAKFEVLVGSESDEADDDETDNDSSLPNLKYAKPKYKDIQSMLKYVESDDDKGGVKLVIMNFND